MSDELEGFKIFFPQYRKGKRGMQVFEGTVLSIKGSGTRRKLTVRKVSGGVGVEKTWFVHSRKLSRIEVVRRAKVRRAKLYYLRNRVGKGTRLEEKRARRPVQNGA